MCLPFHIAFSNIVFFHNFQKQKKAGSISKENPFWNKSSVRLSFLAANCIHAQNDKARKGTLCTITRAKRKKESHLLGMEVAEVESSPHEADEAETAGVADPEGKTIPFQEKKPNSFRHFSNNKSANTIQ